MEEMQSMEKQETVEETQAEPEEIKLKKKRGKKAGARSRGMGIREKLVLLAAVPALVASLAILLVARSILIDGMQDEMIDGLVLLAEAVKGSYNAQSGDFSMGEDGCVYKGEANISSVPESLDIFTAEIDADVTLCWGKTRMVTSLQNADGSRPVGTDIADNVWATVQKGEVYKTSDIVIMDQDYYAAYVPLKNSDGTVVGAVFAGRPSASVTTYITSKVTNLIMIAVAVLVLCVIVGFVIARDCKGNAGGGEGFD